MVFADNGRINIISLYWVAHDYETIISFKWNCNSQWHGTHSKLIRFSVEGTNHGITIRCSEFYAVVREELAEREYVVITAVNAIKGEFAQRKNHRQKLSFKLWSKTYKSLNETTSEWKRRKYLPRLPYNH